MKMARDVALFGAGCCFGAVGLIVIVMIGLFMREQILTSRPLFVTPVAISTPLAINPLPLVVPTQPAPTIVLAEPTFAPTLLPTTIVLPTDIPLPTATPLSTPTLEPAAALNANVRNALGESNRDLSRVASVEYSAALNIINVTWALNLAWNNAAMKTSAQMDAAKILKAVHESGIVFDFMNLTGTTELTDAFGQSTESPVVWYTVEYETLQRINWQDTAFVDFVLYQRIDEIADRSKYHPAFEE